MGRVSSSGAVVGELLDGEYRARLAQRYLVLDNEIAKDRQCERDDAFAVVFAHQQYVGDELP